MMAKCIVQDEGDYPYRDEEIRHEGGRKSHLDEGAEGEQVLEA